MNLLYASHILKCKTHYIFCFGQVRRSKKDRIHYVRIGLIRLIRLGQEGKVKVVQARQDYIRYVAIVRLGQFKYIFVSLCLFLSFLSLCLCYLSLAVSLCLSISTCLSLYLPVYLCVSISVCLSLCVYLCVSISVYLCLSLSVYLYLSISVYLCLSLCISMYLCLTLSISVFLSLCVNLSLCLSFTLLSMHVPRQQ